MEKGVQVKIGIYFFQEDFCHFALDAVERHVERDIFAYGYRRIVYVAHPLHKAEQHAAVIVAVFKPPSVFVDIRVCAERFGHVGGYGLYKRFARHFVGVRRRGYKIIDYRFRVLGNGNGYARVGFYNRRVHLVKPHGYHAFKLFLLVAYRVARHAVEY